MKKYFTINSYTRSISIRLLRTKQIDRFAKIDVLNNPAFISAHTGISIYEPASGKYWYNYQGDKYFVPASNTKLVTCYAAMKYLGDSFAGIRYRELNNKIIIYGAGDPTFSHPDFTQQKSFWLFEKSKKQIMIYNGLS